MRIVIDGLLPGPKFRLDVDDDMDEFTREQAVVRRMESILGHELDPDINVTFHEGGRVLLYYNYAMCGEFDSVRGRFLSYVPPECL